ncbi:phage tail tape measure protein [Lysinibacillus sp. FN11]|uniref:phage tail tape measure protein n=1 Tax=Lysinibacillus sp. FN11 TaxID=2968499 RepID=UPI00214CF186|nr:phage tail tape measure protein [Lysinibacillus sp. FN11]UUV25845.1 phage tail tape measure protein [Lysinibacillus sp. FN11]
MATKNPIELLIALGVNNSTSQQNVNQYIQSLKKYYDRNPLLVSLGINKGNLEKELNEVAKLISKKQNELNVNIGSSNASKGMKDLEGQIDKVILKLTELDRKLKSVGSGSSSSSNLNSLSTTSIGNSISQLQAFNTTSSQSANNLNNLQRAVGNASQGLSNIGNNANQAARSTNELGNAFQQAFTKFPIWLIASSSVFLPIQAISDMTERVVELDTAMTNLRRVMDIPEYKFNEILEKSIENTERLSGKVEDYLRLVGEFGRTGRNDKESLDLANVSTILQNISELTADEAVNSLTAAMISFGIAAEDSITIANKLNEVDNNYSITTRDLSLSMNKAASTARTFGVSLDELLGYTTAIGAATRESGNIVGNSLKTIFSRITTNSSAIGALNDIGISIEDMEGKVKPVSSIIQEIAGKWNQLSDAERQNTAVKVAGTYQLSRFNALMLNYQMAQSATATSMDSFNSAMREQEEYGKSLQARLNQLDAAWWSFSSAVGETVLYDSIIVITSALETMTDSGNGVVSTIGLLPPVITVATVAVYAFSGSFRALVASTYASTSATVAATGATGVFSGALVGLRTVAGLATVALKGLAIATGIGMVFAVAGVAIEKLTNIISENIQKQEELDLYLEKNTTALSSNKEEVEKLITQYNSLSDAKANDSSWDSTKEEEYLKVQQKLGEIFPALIASVDSTGQTHLKNKDAIEQEIKATEKLIDAQNKVTANTAIEEFEKLNDEINGSWYDSLSNFIYGSLESRIKQQKQIIESMQKNGVDTSVQELELLQLEQLYQQASEKIKAKIFEVADAQSSLEIDSNVSESLQNFVSSLDFSGFDNAQLKGFADEFGRIQENIQKAINTNDADLYADSIKSLNDLASTSRGFDRDLNSFTLSYEEFTNAIEKGQIKIVDGEVVIEDMSNSMGSAANSASDLASKMKDFKDVTESLAGVSQSGVDALDELIFQYDMLTNQLAGYTDQQLQDIYTKENLTSKEREVKKVLDDRVAVMKEMSSLYPDLFGKDGKAIALTSEKINAIKAENKANETLLKAYKLARDGKLTAEQQATLASASGTKARIENLKTEIRMLDKYTKANNIAAKVAGAISLVAGVAMTAQQIAAEQALSGYRAELDGLIGSLNTDIGKIDSFTDAIENSGKATKDSTNAQKDKNSTTKDSIYITDKYKQSLEALTLEIEKQQKLQAKYPEHSKEYRKHLEAQIKLEKDKLALQEKQAKALQSQIASGKIQQTGSISTNSSSTSNQNLSGWNGTISSGYGNRTLNGKNEFHRGIDIAMAKGTRLDANIGGKVVASGDAKKNGMSSTYGNVVVIQDTNGMKHIYAHLDKAIAKLGDTITAGMQIGTIGSTGTSTGNHLHYEINKNGNPIDPSNYLNDARNGKVSASYSSSSSQQAVVWNYFKNKGLNDKAIAGIMGNIQQESGFNSSAVNKSSGASGIFQWLGGRKNGLQDYAKSVGKSWSDLQVQLDYAWKELQGSEKKSLASLQRNDLSASQHASEFDRLFERSGGSAVGKRQDYANQYFNQFQGTNGGSGIGIDTSQQAIDQAKSDFYGVQNDALNTREIIEDLNEKLVKSNIAYYNHLSEGVDRSIKKSNILADQQLEHSQAYRDELEKETKHLEYKQSLLHKEANFIREQLKRTDLSPAFKDELTTQLSELSLSWWDVEESIKSVNEQIENSKIAEFDKKIESMNDSISKSNKLMELYAKGSKEYNAEQKNIVTTLYEKQKAYESEAEALRKSIQLDKLSIREIERKKNRLKELSSTWLELQSEIVKINSDIADELINTMKDAYGQQRDYELALKDKQIEDLEELRDAKLNALDEESKAYEESIKEQMDSLDKAHKDKLDKLEEESKAFEDAINRQLELMRKQRDEEDFNKDIGKLQKKKLILLLKLMNYQWMILERLNYSVKNLKKNWLIFVNRLLINKTIDSMSYVSKIFKMN